MALLCIAMAVPILNWIASKEVVAMRLTQYRELYAIIQEEITTDILVGLVKEICPKMFASDLQIQFAKGSDSKVPVHH